LLVAFGSWFLLSFLQWRTESSNRSYDNLRTQKQVLFTLLDRHNRLWPAEPRTGRYATPDKQAIQALDELRNALGTASNLAEQNDDGLPLLLGPIDAALLRGPQALVQILRVQRTLGENWACIEEAQAAAETLRTSEQALLHIPEQIRNEFNDLRAEIRRLSVLTEEMQSEGIQGLEETSGKLEALQDKAEKALDKLANSNLTPELSQGLDATLTELRQDLVQIDQVVSEASEARQKARGTARRVQSSYTLATERWATLKERGASDDDIDRQLSELKPQIDELAQTGEVTLSVLRTQTAEAIGLDSRIDSLMTQLDGYGHLMRASQTTIDNLVPEIEALDALRVSAQAQDGLVPTKTTETIQQARELYKQAVELRLQGTRDTLEEALKLGNQSQQLIDEANRNLQADVARVKRAHQALELLSEENYTASRERLEDLAGDLQNYPQYWSEIAGEAREAMQKLDTARKLVGNIPDEEQMGLRFTQEELDEALTSLEQAVTSKNEGDTIIAQLAETTATIKKQEHELSTALVKLDQDTVPALKQAADNMLPELRQRFDLFVANYESEAQSYRDTGQIHFEKALTEWLPNVKEQANTLLREHQDSVKRYRQAQRDAIRRIDRLWSKLQKLEPGKTPDPEEDLGQLEMDLSIWRTAVDSNEASPRELRELVSIQAEALCRRLERAIEQIEQDRKTLDALSREYLGLQSAIEAHQNTISSLSAESPWHLQEADDSLARDTWADAQALESQSAGASTLTEAREYLQRANSAARRAEQSFATVVQHLQGALRRLNTERQALEKMMAHARRQEATARTEQRLDEAARISALINSAQRSIDTALGTPFSEDALRHLRSGRQALDKL